MDGAIALLVRARSSHGVPQRPRHRTGRHRRTGGPPSPRRRHRGPRVRGGLDSFMVGSASGVSGTAMAVLTLALRPLSSQRGLSPTSILFAAQLAPVALMATQWWFVRRGGMVSRRSVTGMWALAALSLLALAAIPPDAGWTFLPLAAVCMAGVGVGGSVGYHIQANVLDRVGKSHTAGSGPRGDARGVGFAAGVAQSWSLLTGLSSTLGVSYAMEHVGVRPAIAGLGALVAVFAALHTMWDGLPGKRPGTGRGSIWALIRQSPKVARDTIGSYTLYAAWGGLYASVALFGGGPLVQGTMSCVARLLAAGFVLWLGHLADRSERQLMMRVAALCAIGGVVLLATFRGDVLWVPAGFGVAMTEVGCNGVATAVKRALAQGEDPVRQTQLGFLFRFAGYGTWPLVLGAVWLALTPISAGDARVAIMAGQAALLCTALAVLPRIPRRFATHSIKATGDGRLFMAVFPSRVAAGRTWFYFFFVGSHRRIWVDQQGRRRKPGWGFYWLRPGEDVRVVARDLDVRVLLLRCVQGRATSPGLIAGSAALHAVGCVPRCRRELRIHTGGERPQVVGRLARLTVEPVKVSAAFYPLTALPAFLREDLELAPEQMTLEVDPDGPVSVYQIESGALAGRLRLEKRQLHREPR